MFSLVIGTCKIVPPTWTVAIAISTWLFPGGPAASWHVDKLAVARAYYLSGESANRSMMAADYIDLCVRGAIARR